MLYILLLLSSVAISTAQYSPTPTSQKLALDFKALHARCVGPFRAGRSLAVAGHPDQPLTYYFGATGGGVFKSEDGGDTWRSISDSNFTAASIGAITVAPSDPNVIYVGTGETDIRGNISPGDGVMKSTDAGVTWKHLGLNQTQMIADIVVHPTDPNLVMVSAMGQIFGANPERGVYRSTNGGESWKQVLFRNDSTGALTLKMDPLNPRIIYASLWQAYRNAYSLSSGGAGSGLFKSTDGGETWKELTKQPGMPKGTIGKICVDVSRAQRNLIWAMIENENGGLFKSVDAGNSWSRVSSNNDIKQRPWYFSHVYAHPTDANVVYVLNVGMHKSIDGGVNFTGVRTNHGDHHDFWIDPKNPSRMILGDDGGAVVTTDDCRHWTEDDIATAQFYHVSVDSRFPYRLYGAQQDNSTCSIPSRIIGGWSIDKNDWYSVAGFESGYVIPHPTDPDITVGGNYSGYIGRKSQLLNQERDISVYPNNPIGEGAGLRGERFQWTFPILYSLHDPTILYTASQHVWRSSNEGQSWTKISPDLTRNDSTKQVASGGPITKDNTGVEVYNTIFTLTESPTERGVLWAGSDCGKVHVSRDSGTTWTDITPSGLPESMISIIDASTFDNGTAFIAVNRYKHNDAKPYIFKTSNYGASWQKITKGIPDGSFVRVVRQDPFRKGLLYAGTERGLFISFDEGASWSKFMLDLPLTPIHDLVIHPTERDLIVCTHGRSFWIVDDLTPLHQYQPSTKFLTAYAPRHTYRVNGGSWSSPTMSVGENAPAGVLLHYALADTTQSELTIAIRTVARDSVITFSSKKDLKGEAYKVDNNFYKDSLFRPNSHAPTVRKGLNRFAWNMEYPPAEEIENMLLWGGGVDGTRAMPGLYTATIAVGMDTQTVKFEIRMDPRLKVSMSDLKAQFDFHTMANRRLTEIHKTVKRIRNISKQLSVATDRLKDLDSTTIKPLTKLSKTITDSLQKIEQELVQTKAKAFQDLLNYPVKLNNKIATLASVAASADAQPTLQTIELFGILDKKARAYLSQVNEVEATLITQFNQQISELKLPAVLPEKK
ncbi:MAG: glycosyl hydrolase [Ignavibacteria bacterium]|nr:glycosyl hydrolase [Ignavibacteria bacterium]